tara:strand:- start:461 stop:679 length:219 start_codon:yes stop_codon:yes gene_type:complete
MNNFESFGHVIMTMLSKHGDFIHVNWIKDNVPDEHYDSFKDHMRDIARKRGHTLVFGSEHVYCFGGDFDGRL